MNPWNLSAGDLLIFGLALHLIADFPLQNDWMANNKAKRAVGYLKETGEYTTWFLRHPAAYIHAGIHTFFLALVFGWPAFFIGLVHLIIDCRWVVTKWSQLIKQTQPDSFKVKEVTFSKDNRVTMPPRITQLYDIGTEVRIWTDQVFHITCLLVAALLIA